MTGNKSSLELARAAQVAIQWSQVSAQKNAGIRKATAIQTTERVKRMVVRHVRHAGFRQ